MTILNFRKWLNEADYVDPDIAYGVADDRPQFLHGNICPFIFTKDGKIYYGDSHHAHYQITRAHPELWKIYAEFGDQLGVAAARKKLSNEYWLFGRIGHEEYDMDDGDHSNVLLVSFWGDNAEFINQLLKPCLNQLERDRKIDQNRDLVSTVNHGTILIKDLFPATTANPANLKRQQDAQALHLMPPQQKMAQLRANGWKPKKTPWQAAADDSGITRPGQKYWAINSESHL